MDVTIIFNFFQMELLELGHICLFKFLTNSNSIREFQAQTQWFKATEFAVRVVDNGRWTKWSDWESVDINIKFDLSNDLIIIYSQETQIYKVLEQVKSPYDSNGTQVKFRVLDQDYDKGFLRLRVENNGNSQIYVDYADISWVYNVVRTR